MEWIFLSYHHLDSSAAHLLARELEELGKDTFYVYEEGPSDGSVDGSTGESLKERLTAELKKCKKVLFLIGRNWEMKDWIKWEYEFARGQGDKIIIPVLAEGRSMPRREDLPDGYEGFADLSGQRFEPSREGPLKQLIQGVRELVGDKDGARYVWVPPGKFDMGVSALDQEAEKFRNEKRVFDVPVPVGFWIGRTPVTVFQFERFLAESRRKRRHPGIKEFGDESKHENSPYRVPVVNVSWKEAKEYCVWVGGCLPKEREWEYAARAGTVNARCGCDGLDEFAWWQDNAHNFPQPVGLRNKNQWGLHDVLGNVWEWCSDWEVPGTEGEFVKPGHQIVRGGSCASNYEEVRVSRRWFIDGTKRYPDVGFRCVIRDVTKFRPIPDSDRNKITPLVTSVAGLKLT